MLDTAAKHGRNLRQLLDAERLGWFTRWCRERALLCGLAGSLTLGDIDALLETRPDYLGFRTALCAGGERAGVLDEAAVAAVRARIPRESWMAPGRRTA